MTEIKQELNEYLKMLFNISRCGDLIVIGLSILENVDTSRPNLELDYEIVQKSIELLLKRHPLLRAHIEVDEDKRVYFKVTDNEHNRRVVMGQDLICGEMTSRSEVLNELEKLTGKSMDYENKCKLWRAGCFSFKENDKRKYALAFFLPLYMTDALNITSLSIELANLINALTDRVECEEMQKEMPISETEISLIDKEKLIGEKQLEKLQEIKSKTL